MNRRRIYNRHLPSRMYHRHGAYYYCRRDGKFIHLGRDYASALHEYARLVAQPRDSMATLIEQMSVFVLEKVRPSTARQYKIAIRRLQHALQEFRPEQVTHGVVTQLLDHYRDRPAVRNRMLTVLSQTFDLALDRELVPANPCHRIRRQTTKSRDRLLTAGEYLAIYSRASPRLQAIVSLAALTGQRIGDILSLRREQLQDDGIRFTAQKTGKRLVVAWSPELREAVDRAKALQGKVVRPLLFCSRDGEPLRHQNVWREFKKAAADAGVSDVTLHDLRAMSATEAQKQGLDPQLLLGHTDARTTRIYLRSRDVPIVRGPKVAK